MWWLGHCVVGHYVVGHCVVGHSVVGHSVVGALCGGYAMVGNVPNPAQFFPIVNALRCDNIAVCNRTPFTSRDQFFTRGFRSVGQGFSVFI